MQNVEFVQELVKKVENYFAENDWHYEYDEQYSEFEAGITLKCKLKSTRMRVRCLEGGISFNFSLSIGTDDENEQQVMEYITRANFGLNNGGFQLNLDQNYIIYHTYLLCTDIPTSEAIDRNVFTGVQMLERYGNELLAVMFGMKNAKDAIETAEGTARG